MGAQRDRNGTFPVTWPNPRVAGKVPLSTHGSAPHSQQIRHQRCDRNAERGLLLLTDLMVARGMHGQEGIAQTGRLPVREVRRDLS